MGIKRTFRKKVKKLAKVSKALAVKIVDKANEGIKEQIWKYKRNVPVFNIRNTSTVGVPVLTTTSLGNLPVFLDIGGTTTNYGGTYGVAGSMQFSLGDLENNVAYRQMYDHYRIKSVKATFMCGSNSVTPSGSSILPIMYYHVGSDDAAISGLTEDLFLSLDNVKKHQFGQKSQCSVNIVPKTSGYVYNTGTPFSAFAIGNAGQWLDTANPNAIHYGFKFFLQDLNLLSYPATCTEIKVYLSYKLEFKGLKL